MIELYFAIRTVALIVALVIVAAYVGYELWKWFH